MMKAFTAKAAIKPATPGEYPRLSAAAPQATGISQRGTIAGMWRLNFRAKHSWSPFWTSLADTIP